MTEYDPEVAVTLRASEWRAVVECAGNYDVRIPREQGDGGRSLDIISEAVAATRKDAQ